jgi:hypothetical protein
MAAWSRFVLFFEHTPRWTKVSTLEGTGSKTVIKSPWAESWQVKQPPSHFMQAKFIKKVSLQLYTGDESHQDV